MRLDTLTSSTSVTTKGDSSVAGEAKATRDGIVQAVQNFCANPAPAITDADGNLYPTASFELVNGRTAYNIANEVGRGGNAKLKKAIDSYADTDNLRVACEVEMGTEPGPCVTHVSSDDNYIALSDAEKRAIKAMAKDDPALVELLESLDIAYTREPNATLHLYVLDVELGAEVAEDESETADES